MINKFNSVAKYKINLVKSIASVYTTRKFIKGIKDILAFTEISKKKSQNKPNQRNEISLQWKFWKSYERDKKDPTKMYDIMTH